MTLIENSVKKHVLQKFCLRGAQGVYKLYGLVRGILLSVLSLACIEARR